jgi:hypothetical protein
MCLSATRACPMSANRSPIARVVHMSSADDADKLFEWVGIGRRLAVVVSFPQPFRIPGIAQCRLTSSGQPLSKRAFRPNLNVLVVETTQIFRAGYRLRNIGHRNDLVGYVAISI